MLTSEQLKKIRKEARPLIEQQLELAEKIAGFRELVSSHGGDWGQLKALIKAQIQDENDDEGDGKRVRKILDKADYATAYADMLGLAKMNEKNSFDAETGEIEPSGNSGEFTEPDADPKQVNAADAEEGAGAGVPSATHQPEMANEPLQPLETNRELSAAESRGDALGRQSVDTLRAERGRPGEGVTAGETAPNSPSAPDKTDGATAPSAPTNIVRLGSGKPLRPYCQHLDDLTKCGGYGKVHCHGCLQAHVEKQGLTA